MPSEKTRTYEYKRTPGHTEKRFLFLPNARCCNAYCNCFCCKLLLCKYADFHDDKDLDLYQFQLLV